MFKMEASMRCSPFNVIIYCLIKKNVIHLGLIKYLDNSSETFPDLKVWFKNFDVFKKKKMFDLSLNQTLYSFNRCDLIFNENNFLVIGKTKFFGRIQAINATIFESEKNVKELKPNHVKIVNIQEVGGDLEIEFIDKKYPNKMPMVIKKVENELKHKIKTCYS